MRPCRLKFNYLGLQDQNAKKADILRKNPHEGIEKERVNFHNTKKPIHFTIERYGYCKTLEKSVRTIYNIVHFNQNCMLITLLTTDTTFHE